MELKNLNELRIETESKYHNSFSPKDIRLPKSFKELVTQFDNDNITYSEFSFVVQRTSEGKIVAPNPSTKSYLHIRKNCTIIFCRSLTIKKMLWKNLLKAVSIITKMLNPC